MTMPTFIDNPYALVLALCYGLGFAAKQAEAFPNRLIPILVGLIGMVALPAAAKNWDAIHFFNGFLAGLGSTGLDQAIRKLLPGGNQPPTQ